MSFYNYFFCFLLMMLTFSFCNFKPFFTRIPTFMKPAGVTVHGVNSSLPVIRWVFCSYNTGNYRQKKGSSSRQKLITVSGYATPKLVYKNLLYYEKDHINDSTLIDLWTYNLKTKKKTCVKKNAVIRKQSGTTLLLTPNTGALVPLPCYVYNLTTGKSTQIS